MTGVPCCSLYHKSTDVHGRYTVNGHSSWTPKHFHPSQWKLPSICPQVVEFKKMLCRSMRYECRRIPILWKMEISNRQHHRLLGIVKIVDAWASSQTWWIRNSERKAQESLFYQPLQLTVKHANVWEPLCWEILQLEDSLGVQWLGLWAFTTKGRGSVPDWGNWDPADCMAWPKILQLN